ncbi:hypothetical protein [Streptomyces californicus]|uniref:hypothetical protein n=1 Tax=Streptomyces californicus TaxID=67351 RepID=UPI00371022FC
MLGLQVELEVFDLPHTLRQLARTAPHLVPAPGWDAVKKVLVYFNLTSDARLFAREPFTASTPPSAARRPSSASPTPPPRS